MANVCREIFVKVIKYGIEFQLWLHIKRKGIFQNNEKTGWSYIGVSYSTNVPLLFIREKICFNTNISFRWWDDLAYFTILFFHKLVYFISPEKCSILDDISEPFFGHRFCQTSKFWKTSRSHLYNTRYV